MGSKASSATSTETNNLALDASRVNGEGSQIFDSIIVDPSDEVMKKMISEHKAAFEVMMTNNTIQLSSLLDLGAQVLQLADTSQIRLEGMAYNQLATGVDMLREQMALGRYVIDFVDMSVNRGFDLVENLADGTDDRIAQALDLVAEVKTDDAQDMVLIVGGIIAVFGLGAMYLLGRKQ